MAVANDLGLYGRRAIPRTSTFVWLHGGAWRLRVRFWILLSVANGSTVFSAAHERFENSMLSARRRKVRPRRPRSPGKWTARTGVRRPTFGGHRRPLRNRATILIYAEAEEEGWFGHWNGGAPSGISLNRGVGDGCPRGPGDRRRGFEGAAGVIGGPGKCEG